MSFANLREASGAPDYIGGIRSAVRGLWLGVLDYYDFFDAMTSTIRRGLTRAWHEGAASVGIQPDELTPEEKTALETAITSEWAQIHPFALAVEAGAKAQGGALEPLLARAELWGLRYQDVVNQARVKANTDPKLKWTLGIGVKEHCSTCQKLEGKVKRASYFDAQGVRPQNPPNPSLECKGWRCLCTLEPTTDRCSPGPLPKLP
jgi:hypothetical protein